MMAQIAYIDVGNTTKTDCLILKGQMPEDKKKTSCDCYWYEDDITIEDFRTEIKDLLEFYDTVVLGLPIREQLIEERDINGNEVE